MGSSSHQLWLEYVNWFMGIHSNQVHFLFLFVIHQLHFISLFLMTIKGIFSSAFFKMKRVTSKFILFCSINLFGIVFDETKFFFMVIFVWFVLTESRVRN